MSWRRLLTTAVLLLALPLQGWAAAHGCVALQQHGGPASQADGTAAHGHDHGQHHGPASAAEVQATADALAPAFDGAFQADAASAADGTPAACSHCAACCVAAVLTDGADSLGRQQPPAAPWTAWQPTVAVGFITDGPERPPRDLLA